MSTETTNEQPPEDEENVIKDLLEETCTADGLQIGLLCAAMLALGFRYGSGFAGNLAYHALQQGGSTLFEAGVIEEPAWVDTVIAANHGALVVAALALVGVLLIEYHDRVGD
jgi:hypothetical protein